MPWTDSILPLASILAAVAGFSHLLALHSEIRKEIRPLDPA
jgi:hypothetical protein